MPVQRSSSKNGADKISRKVRVALGRSEGLGDGVRKLGLKSSTVDKAHRKVRIAIGGSKGSSDVDGTKNSGSKKGKSRKGDDDAVSYVDVSEKLSEKRRRGKRDLKTHTRNEGLEAVVDWKSGRKRKRIYADPGTVEYSKSSSKSRSNVVRSYLDKGKTVPRGQDHEFKDSSRKTSLAGGSKFMGSELLDKKVRRGKMEGADKLKPVQENGLGNRNPKTSDKGKVLLATEKRDLNRRKHAVGSVEKPHKKKDQGNKSLVTDSDLMEKTVPRGKDHEFKDSSRKTSLARGSKFMGSELLDKKVRRGKMEGADKLKPVQENGLGNRKSKTSDKGKVLLATEKGDLYRRKHAFGSVEKPHKKKDQGNKSLVTDSDLTEKPKKKKRVIRIDPHDISNKRLDDEKANNGNSKAKIDLTENIDVEMSKNAQFRAIRPSPSILSFVEDNLLGRRRDIEFRKAGYNTELASPLDNIPFSTSSERERIEIPVFRNKLEFFAAAKISSSFPSPDLPEIAFAGRSNVGKSSLLNALTRQWGVVRTSDKPGLTQTINFFKLGSKLCLVDLPGYGFAYAKEEVKEAWEELVKEYVSTRVGLKRVCLLVDTKWGMKPRDHELIDLMERSQTKYQIVLTKTDMVFPMDVARRAMQIEENLKEKKSAVQPLMMVSSKTGAGVRSLRTVLAKVARLVRR